MKLNTKLHSRFGGFEENATIADVEDASDFQDEDVHHNPQLHPAVELSEESVHTNDI